MVLGGAVNSQDDTNVRNSRSVPMDTWCQEPVGLVEDRTQTTAGFRLVDDYQGL